MPLKNLLESNNGGHYHTRTNSLAVPPHRGTKFNRSFLCKSIMDWLKLPVVDKTVQNLRNFAKNLKHNLLDKY